MKKGAPNVKKSVTFKEKLQKTRTYKPDVKESNDGLHIGEVRNVLQIVRTVLDISEDIQVLDEWYNGHSSATSKEQYEEDRAELVRELEKAKQRHFQLAHD